MIPARPLLAPWYRLVEDGDRLMLEHGQTVVVLEGAAVRTLVPALLPLLDGTHSLEELVVRMGPPVRTAIESAIETLARHGLLTEGPAAPARSRATGDAFAAAYGVPPSAVAERLASAIVSIVGESPAGAEIARLLLAAGVGEVRRGVWESGGEVDLAVVTPATDELARFGPWNAAAIATGRPWLPVRPFDGRLAAVGPLIVPDESCCYECVLLRRGANLEYGADLAAIETTPIAATADPAFESLVVAFAAHLVLRWVAGHDRTLPGLLYAVEPQPTLTITEHTVLRVPRCPACSRAERVAAPLPWHAAEAA
jgi:bacteriocin biosynthesis cyclodehydratase domain-containing protein